MTGLVPIRPMPIEGASNTPKSKPIEVDICELAENSQSAFDRMQSLYNSIPSLPIFDSFRQKFNEYLEKYGWYIQKLQDICAAKELPDMPEYLKPDYVAPCTATALKPGIDLKTNLPSAFRARRVPIKSEKEWFTFIFDEGTELHVIARANDPANNETFYLVRLKNTTADKSKDNTVIHETSVYWVHSSSISVNEECANDVPTEVPYVGFPPVGYAAGRYFQGWRGMQRAMGIAESYPDGWWGEDGLDISEFIAWVLQAEVGPILDGFEDDIARREFLDLYIAGNYFRYRDAFLKCAENATNYECEGIYQFLAGLTASFLPPVCDDPPASIFKPLEERSDEEKVKIDNWLILQEAKGCKAWVNFVTYNRQSDDKLDLIEQRFDEIRRRNDRIGDFNLDASWQNLPELQVGAISWWSNNELPCDKRKQYATATENSGLWLRKLENTTDDPWFYLGTLGQFINAKIIAPKSDDEC